MLMPILSGLIVSVDAFFIGLSLGLQSRCKFIYLAIINAFLFGLCIFGFFIAGQIYEHIPFDPDIIVGFAFIALGIWTIFQYIVCRCIKRCSGKAEEESTTIRTYTLVGLVMSVEAMLITMGLTFVFLPNSTIVIPITVAFAHFGYSSLSFYLARTKHMKRIPTALSYIISGVALIIYGLMALFIEIGSNLWC